MAPKPVASGTGMAPVGPLGIEESIKKEFT